MVNAKRLFSNNFEKRLYDVYFVANLLKFHLSMLSLYKNLLSFSFLNTI